MAKLNLIDCDYSKVAKGKQEVEVATVEIHKMVQTVVDKYCADLDKLLEGIQEVLFDTKDNELTSAELDRIVLKLPLLIYFGGTGQEYVGLQEDVAKFARQLEFSKHFNNAAGTVADKTNYAETKVNEEEAVRVIYSRAYKIIRGKMEMALELLQSAKKVISRRMGEQNVPEDNR